MGRWGGEWLLAGWLAVDVLRVWRLFIHQYRTLTARADVALLNELAFEVHKEISLILVVMRMNELNELSILFIYFNVQTRQNKANKQSRSPKENISIIHYPHIVFVHPPRPRSSLVPRTHSHSHSHLHKPTHYPLTNRSPLTHHHHPPTPFPLHLPRQPHPHIPALLLPSHHRTLLPLPPLPFPRLTLSPHYNPFCE